MKSSVLDSQYKALKNIIKNISKSQLYKSLELGYLKNETVADILHEEYCERVPVMNGLGYLNYLRTISSQPRGEYYDVYSTPYLVNNSVLSQVIKNGKDLLPVNGNVIRESFALEKAILNGDVEGLYPVKGKLFHIFGGLDSTHLSGLDIGNFGYLRQCQLPWTLKRKVLPDVNDLPRVGNSQYQRLHAFIDNLSKNGGNVEVLLTRAQTLVEMSLLLSQREGRSVRLKELCPNLKSFVYYGESILPYKKEISEFMAGLSCIQVEAMLSPSGAVAIQNSVLTTRQLKLLNEKEVFYEFISVDDLKSDGTLSKHYKRQSVMDVRSGKEYLLVCSNSSGLLAYNTHKVFKVVSTDPFLLEYQRTVFTLDTFGERIRLNELEYNISKVNESMENYGFHIREYMIGDDIEARKPVWVFELNGSVSSIQKDYLQVAANSIHNEMSFQNKNYRTAISSGFMPIPIMKFVSLGAFSSTFTSGSKVEHIDATDDISEIKALLDHVEDVVTVQPVDV